MGTMFEFITRMGYHFSRKIGEILFCLAGLCQCNVQPGAWWQLKGTNPLVTRVQKNPLKIYFYCLNL